VSAKANNVLVRTDTLAKDPEQTALIGAYEARIRPLAERKVGSITASLSREEDPAGESVLGQIIADAQLAATGPEHVDGAVIAFTHPGGIRNDMPRSADGTVTYADLFAVQPFGNVLVTLTFTGAQIKMLLEQQWLDQPRPRILKVSRGFSYTWDDRRPAGNFVDGASIMLNGKPIDPGGRYRVTVNGFLADGGDNFAILREGTEPRTGVTELAALEAYFKANDPVSPGKLDRIHRVQ
jgi:5'-nucleotidase